MSQILIQIYIGGIQEIIYLHWRVVRDNLSRVFVIKRNRNRSYLQIKRYIQEIIYLHWRVVRDNFESCICHEKESQSFLFANEKLFERDTFKKSFICIGGW